ncbi:unnamed protein product [Rotaria sp. Silwood2]|nr:unnamed protein product [Rotaria sp. Silwood2]CAF4587268.1 unnamed protein product [Rotaria sp. Silwood2]
MNDNVKAVNNRCGLSQRKIGRRFRVNHSTISRNLRRRTSVVIRKRRKAPKMNSEQQQIRARKNCARAHYSNIVQQLLNEKNIPFIAPADNPPNAAQARPIEIFSYLIVFDYRVVNFSNASAGYLLLIGQIADAISTVFVGWGSDRTRTSLCHYGRRKTWHLIGVICVLISFPFCFNLCIGCKDSYLWVQFIYYALFIIIFQFGWACSQVAHL